MNVPLLLAIAFLPSVNGNTALTPALRGHDETLKCPSPDLPGYVIVVDGEVVRDYRGTGPDTATAGNVLPDATEVIGVEVRCLRVRSTEMESGWALRSAIIVLSKSGAPKVAQAQLTELVEEQRLHRARVGMYARSLKDLGFTDTRANLGIEMTVNAKGWSATVSFKDLNLRCRVAVDDAAAVDQELRPGVPACASG